MKFSIYLNRRVFIMDQTDHKGAVWPEFTLFFSLFRQLYNSSKMDLKIFASEQHGDDKVSEH